MFGKIKSILSKWWIALILGILCIIAGVWCMQNPVDAVGVLAKVLVVVFILTGIYGAIFVLNNKDNIPAWGWDLAAAVITVILGIVLLFAPAAQYGLICGLFGAGVLMIGINGIEAALAQKKLKIKTWWVILILGILNIIMAFMLAFNPVVEILTVGMWAGFAAILKGVEYIVLSITMSKANSAVKNAEKEVKAEIETAKKEYAEDLKAVKEAVEKEYGVDLDKAAEEIKKELGAAAEEYKKAAENAGKEE